MPTAAYQQRRSQIETYFDRTAAEAWSRLTSDAPVGRIRQTVRAGRDAMRATILDWLGDDLTGRRILDAGCGTGALAIEAANRGADVVAIDIAGTLIDLARKRTPERTTQHSGHGSISFHVGDMLNPELGAFDHVVAMDSLIHYAAADKTDVVAQLAARASRSMVFTFAPRTPMLAAMHAVGRLFPRGDRAPSIVPVAEADLIARLKARAELSGHMIVRTHRIKSGFYISQALEVVAG